MIKKRPAYKVKINPDDDISGVYAISLVDFPAIESDFIKLSAQEVIDYAFSANKDKQMLFGALLIPNKLIFRRNEKTGEEFDIFFDEETIQLIADKYNEKKIGDIFNFMHSDVKVEAFLLQNWITGKIDKSQEYGFSLPEGSWFAGIKVKNEDFWLNQVKTDKVNGFSVEINVSDLELVQLNKTKIKLQIMEIKTNEGVSLYYDGEISEGTAVFLDESMTQNAPEGAHMLEDGRVITLDANSVIVAIADATPDLPFEEDLAVDEYAPVDTTPTGLDPQAVLDVVAPMFEEMRAVHGEMMAKMAELEMKIADLESNSSAGMEKVEELKTQVETLSKTPASESITKKVDSKVAKREEVLLSKINAFGRIKSTKI